ncbi:hypothetical protein M9Y10_022072 [Tritrichomonas musculus]|uniref:ubiquitinyl hydrolase 1 n=1 Tax=Tritrichomonas musculus TaxID=1915356 RepID=A0ABR2KSA6_9EUKA
MIDRIDNLTSIEDQFQLLEELYNGDQPRYIKGDKEGYLLSFKWYHNCFDFISSSNKQKEDHENSTYQILPPIDNSDLIDENCIFYNDQNKLPNYFILNRKKKINIDFIVIKSKEWSMLHSKFSGGPSLSVPVCSYNSFQTTLHSVTDFIDILVSYKQNLNHNFVTYKEIKGKELENNIRSFFNVPKQEKTRLMHLSKIVKPEKNLDQQLINNNYIFILEYQDESGNWVSSTNNSEGDKNFSPDKVQQKESESFSLSQQEITEVPSPHLIDKLTLPPLFSSHEEKQENQVKDISSTPIPPKYPPPSEQLKIFQELERINNTFEQGENKAYLISQKWFRIWKNIVDPESQNNIKIVYNNNDDDDQNDDAADSIPPINNIDLMIYDEKTKKLKPDRTKYENIHYRILHPAVWEKLHEWFDGGPEIPIPVYYNNSQKKNIPVVKYYDIPIDYKDNKDNSFEIGSNTPLSIIHSRARSFYNVPKEEKTRICTMKQGMPRVLHDNDGQTLDFYFCFNPSTHLILDYKDIDSSEWNLKANSTYTCRSSSSMRPITNSHSISDFSDEKKESESKSISNLQSKTSSNSNQSSDSADTDDDKDPFKDIRVNKYDRNNDHECYHYSHSYYNSSTSGPGVCGLENLGNTCFFNSGIQCLVHTRLLVKYILSGKWKYELNRSNPIGMHGEIAEAFANLTYKIWSGNYNTFSPTYMKDVIGRFAPQFSGYGQQDSHELITFMLDGIHEDLNRVTKKPVVESISGDGNNDEEIADESWRRYKSRNDSVIVDLFHSQLRSRLVCPKCHKITVVFDPYMSLQLPIHKPNKVTLNLIFVPSKYEMLSENEDDFPFNVHCQHIKISFYRNKSLDPEELSRLVSKKIGRKVNAIVVYKENGTIPSLKWGVNIRGNDTHYALEVPKLDNANDDDTDNRKFVICYLISKAKKKYEFFMNSSDEYAQVTPPFLIPIKNFSISNEQFLKDCEKFFSGYWSGVDTPLSDQQKQFMQTLKIELLRSNGQLPSQKVPKILRETIFKPFQASNFDPRVASSIQPISINQETMGKEYNFSFYLYLKHIKNLKFNSFNNQISSSFTDSSIELEKCFKYFSSNETLDENNKWFCPHCRDFVCADKKMDIWSAPEVLVIQLKRFIRINELFMKKLETTVHYPSEIDISQFLAGPQHNERMLYRLYAVSEHSGSLSGGHYTAHAKVSKKDMSESGGKWYSFNDSYVSSSSSKSAYNNAAYVLFYERINNDPSSDNQSANMSSS